MSPKFCKRISISLPQICFTIEGEYCCLSCCFRTIATKIYKLIHSELPLYFEYMITEGKPTRVINECIYKQTKVSCYII